MAWEYVIESLKDIAPDIARYVIEFPFGYVYFPGVLTLKEHEIATVAALAALGNARLQHINGALNVCCREHDVGIAHGLYIRDNTRQQEIKSQIV